MNLKEVNSMTLEFLETPLAVVKLNKLIPTEGDFVFTAKTDKEFSLVCEEKYIPNDTISIEKGWIAFRVVGTLDFSLVGILSPILNILADEKIGVFAVSTFDTDYVLLKKDNCDKAKNTLIQNGYDVI